MVGKPLNKKHFQGYTFVADYRAELVILYPPMEYVHRTAIKPRPLGAESMFW